MKTLLGHDLDKVVIDLIDSDNYCDDDVIAALKWFIVNLMGIGYKPESYIGDGITHICTFSMFKYIGVCKKLEADEDDDFNNGEIIFHDGTYYFDSNLAMITLSELIAVHKDSISACESQRTVDYSWVYKRFTANS